MVDTGRVRDNPKYNARVKYYPNGTQKITIFNKGVFNPDKWEEVVLTNSQEEKREYDLTNPRNDNVKRAKDKIFDIAFINEWDYMVTLTLDKNKINRYDSKEINKRVKEWLNNTAKRKGLKYLLVPEYHKDGAIHFHGFFNQGNLTYLKSNKSDSGGRDIYNIKDWRFGFSTAVKLDDNRLAVSRYITKYITKDCRKIFGKFYFAGGGIIRDVPCEYIHVCYDDYECKEYDIPEAGMKVKYIVIGDL